MSTPPDPFPEIAPSGPPIAVRKTAASISPRAFCEHGQLAFHVALLDVDGKRTDVILPRCLVQDLVGGMVALIAHCEGHAPAQAFSDAAAQAAQDTANRLATDCRHD